MDQVTSAEIKDQARILGFDKTGIVAATALTAEGVQLNEWLSRGFHGSMGYMDREPEKRIDPRLLMPSARSVVSVALNYYRSGEHSEDAEIGKISRYAWGNDYHDVLRERLASLLAWIRTRVEGVEGKICVDSSPAMDKVWAQRAGLGWIGKHTNLITQEFGSWVFLGELLLSIELEYDTYVSPDHCGSCTACIEACPTQAIIGPYQLDGSRCISYGTIELRDSELPEVIASNLENWVFGCDICQDVCPWTRFSKETRESAFEPRPGVVTPALDDLQAMSQEEFVERFRGSPVKRTKLAGLKRNARAASDNHQTDLQ
jgi:epoxyqueuosine reductase